MTLPKLSSYPRNMFSGRGVPCEKTIIELAANLIHVWLEGLAIASLIEVAQFICHVGVVLSFRDVVCTMRIKS